MRHITTHNQRPPVILASASPRRSALLQQIGVDHEVMAVDIDERPLEREEAEDYVTRLAMAKGAALWQQLDAEDQRPLLSADTALEYEGEIIGKPASFDHFRSIMQRLSGQTHRVWTAVALHSEMMVAHRISMSEVTLRPLTDSEIDAYWQSGEPHDKAGGYAIQGLGGQLVSQLNGSYSGVVGLPLEKTAELLEAIGIEPQLKPQGGHPEWGER